MKPSVSRSTFSSPVKLSSARVRDQPFGGRGSAVGLDVLCRSSRTKGRAGKRQQELQTGAARGLSLEPQFPLITRGVLFLSHVFFSSRGRCRAPLVRGRRAGGEA